MKKIILSFSTVCVVIFSACSTNQVGRKQLKLVNQSEMASLGDKSFGEMKQKLKVSRSISLNRRVKCITNRLLKNMGEDPNKWEVQVFEDSSPNAFALPGRNIGVHTGMIELVKSDDQLAAVIGHEIGHVTLDHGNERVSQAMLAQAGLSVADMLLGESSENQKLLMAALGLGAQYGVLLPFSRKQETEADRIGLEYSANAGFKPQGAVELWQLMGKKSGGKNPPEFLSTHPSTDSRIEELKKTAPQFEGNYQAAQTKSPCY